MNSSRCPRCHADLPATERPQGLCPKCLLAVAMGESKVLRTQDGAPLPEPPTPEELAPAFPQLEILEVVGRGGMGVVYKARQRGLDRLIALKILDVDERDDPAFAERFRREARAMAGLSHPNVAAVHDSGRAGNRYYLVLEFVDGPNLRQLITTHAVQPQEALAIVTQICSALEYAHGEGVVHRDIKPENVLVDPRGRVKIVDFGLAKLLGRSTHEPTLTRTHQAMGTWHYMAPEQVERPLEVDHRADIYSLGVVFYELLTGELPIGRFEAPSEKVQIDVRLDDVVLRSLEKDPERRYQRAADVRDDVEHISSTDGGRRRRRGRRGRRHGRDLWRNIGDDLFGSVEFSAKKEGEDAEEPEEARAFVHATLPRHAFVLQTSVRTLLTVCCSLALAFGTVYAVRFFRRLPHFLPLEPEGAATAAGLDETSAWPWPAGAVGLDESLDPGAALVAARHFERYAAVEREHTRVSWRSASSQPVRQVTLTIDPFPARLRELEQSFELELAGAVEPSRLESVRRDLRGELLFPFGRAERRVLLTAVPLALDGVVVDEYEVKVLGSEGSQDLYFYDTFRRGVPWNYERFLRWLEPPTAEPETREGDE